MRIKMKKVIYLIIGCLGFVSCGDFLKEYSQDLVYASSLEDMDEVLIGNGYMKHEGYPSFVFSSGQANAVYYMWLNVMDDDIQEFGSGPYSVGNSGNPSEYLRSFYEWSKVPFQNEKGVPYDDENWKKLYSHISYSNVIISQVDEFSEDSKGAKRRIKGEAQFLRAAYYYLLVNFYANPYVKATAETDPGVPLKLIEKVDDKYYSRNSIAEVYNQIVKDLKDAAENLTGVEQPTVYRVNEAAARILLSRVYLYMGEWQLAADECDRVMKLGIHLSNLNDFDLTETIGVPGDKLRVTKAQYMNTSQSPEVLFTQGSNGCPYLMFDKTSIGRYAVSQELCDLYTKYPEVTDLRLTGFFSKSQVNGNYRFVRKTSDVLADMTTFDCFIIRSAEAYLNKAEAEAMLGGDAITPIKKLLENRFAGGQIPAIDGLSGKELVEFIRDERRRELCFESQRWFDLRRYAVCVKYPESKEIDHVSYLPATAANANGIPNGTYRLKRYEEERAYVLPIPGYEIVFNRGELVDNPEREDREAI